MVVVTQGMSAMASSVEVMMTTNSKPPTFSGKHGDEWTIWEMKTIAHLMDKRLNECFEPEFENRLPANESGPFDLTTEEDKKFKEAVDQNKKVMGQFIQAFFLTINLLNKVNLQKKADKTYPSGKGWKL